jgi:hypothetical protein
MKTLTVDNGSVQEDADPGMNTAKILALLTIYAGLAGWFLYVSLSLIAAGAP